jgi:chitinase
VTVTSSNLTLLPLNRITLGGSGANRTITLNPALNRSGSVTITLTVSDGEFTDTSQFILAVNAVNDAPVAQSQTLTTNANTPVNITLQATDVENSALTYSIITAPAHGTLSGTGASRTYTPAANYSGTDSFTFRANDGSANSNTATINLTVRPTLSINNVSITEGNSGSQAATFTVTLAGISSQSITVNYATANGTSNPATAGSDYGAANGTLTFAAGQTSKTITVMVNGDATIEANETFFVNLSSASGAIITDSQGMGTIIDNDSGSKLNINDVTVQEGNSGTISATFTVTLTSASAQTVTVTATTVNGTAKAPGDYTARNISFSFAPGQVSRTINVTVNGDLLDEVNEVFYVLLSSPVNAAINRGRGVCTITDDDVTPTLSIDDIIVKEYNTGQTTAALRLKLSALSGKSVKVSYATANGTATGGSDYGAVAPTVVAFNAGSLYAYARVLINGDLLPEANETFLVNLSSPQNAILTDNQAIGTILNDDSPPALTINNVSIAEGNSGTKTLTFTVTLSKASGQTVTVKYATADGIARSTSDYVAKSGTLSFAPGTALTRTISITINGDTLFEGNETLFVLLSGAVNASIGTARGTGTITNDDSSG